MTEHHIADSHQYIEIHGARHNNLRNVSLVIPKRRLTVFTGVSGSGKSSLVFGTIAAESQRLINETYSTFVQGFMPSQDRPEVDALEGLTTAIIVDQERIGGNPRSTVGTATDATAMLRTLFSRVAQPNLGSPGAYSFNVPSVTATGARKVEKGGDAKVEHVTFKRTGGMCPRCEGLGRISDIDLTQLYDETKSLEDGPFTIPGYNPGGWNERLFRGSGFYPSDVPIKDFTEQQLQDFLYKEPVRIKVEGINMTYEGLVPRLQKSMFSKDQDAVQPHVRAFVNRAVTFVACPECQGTRLSGPARNSFVEGKNIADLCSMQVSDLAQWVKNLDYPEVTPLLNNLVHTLESFVHIGLGYLSLDRPASTLSGGEAQRAKMIRHLGSALTDVTYVFDEPTVGLHPHDIERMNQLLLSLRDKGNTVLVVEHKPETIAIADHVVDMGPAAGSHGGQICYEGDIEGLRTSGTVTGIHLGDKAQLKDAVRQPTGHLQVRGASANNLKNVDVDIPLGVLTAVTGVAGSGKSSLIHGALVDGETQEIDGTKYPVVVVDQTPIKGSRRLNPGTYTGVLEPIRKAFAKANGVKPALFSANSEGACPTCKGSGTIDTDLGMMATVSTVCETCEGKRFDTSVLEYTLGGVNISDVLEMSAEQAFEFFSAKETKVAAAAKILKRFVEVGLGYIKLGQPLNTLSGGERQRMKLVTKMDEAAGIFVLDEPTTGLHLADVEQMLTLLDHLVDSGKTVIVIEHHQAVMAHADFIIDLGPGAGHDGGSVVFTGTPAELVEQGSTLTSQHLTRYIHG